MAHRPRPADPKPPDGIHFAKVLPYRTVRTLNHQSLVHTIIYLLNQAKRFRCSCDISIVAPDREMARRVSEALVMREMACRVDDLAPRGHISIKFQMTEVG